MLSLAHIDLVHISTIEIIMHMTLDQRRSATRELLKQASLNTATEQRWDYLIAAHIAGQTVMALHWQTHIAMLVQALRERDAREACGQLLRLLLIPMGHMLNRLPLGNTGRSRISALTPMPIKPHHRSLIEQAMAAS